MLTKIKVILGSVVALAIVSISIAGYIYVSNLNNQITDLTATNEKLYIETKTMADTLDKQTSYVEELVDDINKLNVSKTELEKNLIANEIEIKSKINTINKMNNEMLIRKAEMLEKRINAGTKKVFVDIEGVFKNE